MKIQVNNESIKKIIDERYEQSKINETFIIDLTDLDTKEVTDMSGLFENKYYLKEVNIQGLNLSKVKTMKRMFKNCYDLKKFNGELELNNINDISYIFSGCYKLEKVKLNSLQPLENININGMFRGCYSLNEINGYEFITNSLTFEKMSKEEQKRLFINTKAYEKSKYKLFKRRKNEKTYNGK